VSEVRKYPTANMILVAFSIIIILSTSFLVHAFTYREPIYNEDISFNAEVGNVFTRYYQRIEDGYEIGFILSETTSNISFTILFSDYSYNDDELSNYALMLDSSFAFEESQGNTKISIKSKGYYVSIFIYLYISDISDYNDSTLINAQYFEQRGTLSSQTLLFGFILFLFTTFWIIIYGSLRKKIKQTLREYKRTRLIKRGKLKVGPSTKKKPEKAIDFVFGKRNDEDLLYPKR
jgi:hypothetical protein